MYIIAQFVFGFNSAFSGQPLYEKVIYQLYNITFTSWPIMWLAVFDYQHLRDREEDIKNQDKKGKLGRNEKQMNKDYDRSKGDD